MNPEKDGIDHINVYSKGKTRLGKRLSNFQLGYFTIPFLGTFASVEGFWYWCITKDERCKELYGFEAKRVGKELPKVGEPPSKRLLKIAYKAKIAWNPILKKELQESTLPFTHYYAYGGKVVCPKEFLWTGELWNEIREEIK
jgi:hypothetical protein